MKSDFKSKIFNFIVYFTLGLTVLICILPFLHIMAISLSDNSAVMSQKVSLFPIGFNIKAYIEVFSDQTMMDSLGFTALMTLLVAVIGLLITIALAYPLSRKSLKGRKIFMYLILFTFYFNAGIIPNYINIQELGLFNSIWVLILPVVLSPFNMILMKNYIQTAIPESLEESAKLDGCSEVGFLIRIVLPLSKPILATIALFFAVGRWNGFQDALYYIQSKPLYPLQLKLFYLVSAAQSTESFSAEGMATAFTPEVVRAASIMFATIPILIVYPFLQKYFVKGALLGSIKE
ncbi:MAG TPA: carbohydrate ABC transporter permease [Bacillota bacterium]